MPRFHTSFTKSWLQVSRVPTRLTLARVRSPQQAAGLSGMFIKQMQLHVLRAFLVPDIPTNDFRSHRIPTERTK